MHITVRQGALGLVMALASPAVSAASCAESPALPHGIALLYSDGPNRAVLREGDGRTWRLQAAGNQMVLEPMGAPATTTPPSDDALPDALVSSGRHDVRRAWLAGPTGRYPHGDLGDTNEATTLRVEMADGRQLQYTLDQQSVFEDRYPRVVDLDGDGRDELVVVRSYLNRGSALSVFGVRDQQIVPLAETAPTGSPNRWLNPAGFPDLDGDGKPEVAVVINPDSGGTLQIYRYGAGVLTPTWHLDGISNHVAGSAELAMSAVTDLNRDGRHELILPADGRQILYQVWLTKEGLRPWRIARHADPISTAILAGDFDSDGRLELLYGLSDGRLVFCSF